MSNEFASHFTRPHLATFAVLVVLGCGGSSGNSETSSVAVHDAIPGPPRPWAELSHEEHGAYMAREVLPRMSALFSAYDGERYAEFECVTCHGADARERNFAMPNPSILPLHPTGSAGQHQTVRDHPEGVRFMYNQVLPTMQALLGASAFNEATGEGFTCYACHTHADAGPS